LSRFFYKKIVFLATIHVRFVPFHHGISRTVHYNTAISIVEVFH